MTVSSFFDSVASVLSGIARRHGMEAKLLEHKLLKQWPAIAGEPIASHTRPDQIKFKKLYLVAENSVWLQQLTFMKPELVGKINAAAGSDLVTDIILRVGSVKQSARAPDAAPAEPPMAAAPSPELLAEAEAKTAVVSDPELRAKLAHMMTQALSDPARSKR
jgi:hypothetical protein